RDIIEGFAATIDTAAWVVLLLMFELETWVIEDRHVSPKLHWTLRFLRATCYAVIVYAFYGYLSKLLFLYGAVPLAGANDLCSLVGNGWAYAIDFDEYELLNAGNCGVLSAGSSFMQLPTLTAVVNLPGYQEILRLAWVDVINAGVWLGVVALLEFDVQMQSRDRLHGLTKSISNWSKYIMYSILFLAAVYWGVKGDFIDFWDAFLWLLAFAFIEMNFFEWQREMRDAKLQRAATPGYS
ncbi:MAG: hypothetical protein WEA08_09205, partial [Woeseia sp.]